MPLDVRTIDAVTWHDEVMATRHTNGPRLAMAADEKSELSLEGATMALYVAVVLLASLVVLKDNRNANDVDLVELIWGTTLGLALAHFFAFRISSRLVRRTSFDRHDMRMALAQLGGAAAVALLCTIPVVLLPADSEDDAIRLVLGLLLGIAGYAAGRGGGGSRLRSLALGAATFAIGVSVALLKNALVGH